MLIVLISDFASVLKSYTNKSNEESDLVAFYKQFIQSFFH